MCSFIFAKIPIDYLLPDRYLCRGGVEDGDGSSTEAWPRKAENGSSFPWPRHYCFPNIPRRSFSLSRFGFDQSVSFRTSKAPHSLCSMGIILFYLDWIDRDRHQDRQIVSRRTDYSYEIRIDGHGSRPGGRRTDEPIALEAKRNSEE